MFFIENIEFIIMIIRILQKVGYAALGYIFGLFIVSKGLTWRDGKFWIAILFAVLAFSVWNFAMDVVDSHITHWLLVLSIAAKS